jgi:hypothetical protein
MNWLPTPPTDSLHKYVALNGLWFTYAVLAVLAVMHYQNFEHQEFNKHQSWLFAKQESLRKFDARLASLSKGKNSENAIPSISDHFTPRDEKAFLQEASSQAREEIAQLTEQTKNVPGNLFLLGAYFRIDVIIMVMALAAWLFAYWGFRNWIKSQRVADEIQKIDLELKRLQLKEASRDQ